MTVPAIKLWSPEQRSLYTAVVSIGGSGGGSATAAATDSAVTDSATTRFGVRTIAVSGYKLLLNGQRVFLAGYGDDAIYPLTVSPPREKAVYAAKLQFAHEHGFNFVRHHSHVLPPEYFEASDEWGVMISPELPCVYGSFFNDANATGQQLYLDSWRSYISSLRNHPSIFDWPLCNEHYMGDTFKLDGQTFGARKFWEIKQELDPTRLMMDQYGSCSSQEVRESLSFCSHQFDVFNISATIRQGIAWVATCQTSTIRSATRRAAPSRQRPRSQRSATRLAITTTTRVSSL